MNYVLGTISMKVVVDDGTWRLAGSGEAFGREPGPQTERRRSVLVSCTGKAGTAWRLGRRIRTGEERDRHMATNARVRAMICTETFC